MIYYVKETQVTITTTSSADMDCLAAVQQRDSGSVNRAVTYEPQGWWFISQFFRFLATYRTVPRQDNDPQTLGTLRGLPFRPKGPRMFFLALTLILFS